VTLRTQRILLSIVGFIFVGVFWSLLALLILSGGRL
jgi:hypothetical protein